LDWYLIVEQDKTQALKAARLGLLGNIGIGVLVTLLVIGLVVIVVNLYISKLEETANRVVIWE